MLYSRPVFESATRPAELALPAACVDDTSGETAPLLWAPPGRPAAPSARSVDLHNEWRFRREAQLISEHIEHPHVKAAGAGSQATHLDLVHGNGGDTRGCLPYCNVAHRQSPDLRSARTDSNTSVLKLSLRVLERSHPCGLCRVITDRFWRARPLMVFDLRSSPCNLASIGGCATVSEHEAVADAAESPFTNPQDG